MIRPEVIPPDRRKAPCKGCGRPGACCRVAINQPGVFVRAWELCEDCTRRLYSGLDTIVRTTLAA